MKLKRIFLSVILALAMVLGLALPVLADSFLSYYPITIEDTSSGGRTNLPIITGVEGQDLIDAGLISASGTNTRMRVGSNDIYYMPSETQIPVFLGNLPASGQTVVDLYTGYDPVSTDDWRVITGEDGYVTVTDDDTLELDDDFEIEQKGWIDTTGGADTNLIYKQHTFRTYIDGSEDITSEITPWTSGTYRPDPHDEVTSVDGRVNDDGSDATWAVVRVEPGSTAVDNDASWTEIIYIESSATNDQWRGIGRSIYLFDTSAIPDTATVISAVFSIYGASKSDGLVITPNINVYASAPASDVALVAGDFDSLGETAFCDTPITYAGWDIADYNDFTLNADGIAAIDIEGITKLGVRNATFDADAAIPTNWVINQDSKLGGYYADEAGTDKDPKLVVTYTDTVVDVTAPSITDEEYTVRTYGVANEPEWATGDVLHFTGAATSNVDCGVIHEADAKMWVSLWFKLDTAIPTGGSGTDQMVWGKYDDGTDYMVLYISGGAGYLKLESNIGGAGVANTISNQTAWADTWYHIIFSVSDVAGKRLIINGGTAKTNADVAGTPTGGDFIIGSLTDGGATGIVGVIQNVIVGTDDLTLLMTGTNTDLIATNLVTQDVSGATGYVVDTAATWITVARTNAIAFVDGQNVVEDGDAADLLTNVLLSTDEEYNLYAGTAPADANNYWYIDEGTDDNIYDYGLDNNEGDADDANTWETATFTTGETGRLCDFYIEVDDGVTDADRWGVNLKGDSVPNSEYDYIIGQNNTIPYAEYHKISVGGTLIAWYEPNTMVDATAYDGTADNGTLTTIVDAELVQADDYWNLALLTITDTTDDLAPEGETSVITDFDDGTNTLTFSALTVAPENLDTYTVDFATLTDREGGDEDARLTWGVNSSVTITYGEIESDEPTASVVSEEPGYDVPEADMPTEWYGTGANVANLPLYDMYLGIETQTGIPVQTLYIFSIVGMCFAFAIAGFVMFNSVMMGVIGIVVALGIGTSMTIVPMWITFTFLVLAIGIMYLKGRSGI